MPHCYLLLSCSGSSVDQHSNNVTLFNLVEQINVPPGAPPPPRGLVPVEIHAYFHVSHHEFARDFEVRFVMVASTGLETPSDTFTHRAVTPRYRTRTFGLPFPPVAGQYELRVDLRMAGEESFRREPPAWPIAIVETSPEPRAVH
jgi:hypothetical protein